MSKIAILITEKRHFFQYRPLVMNLKECDYDFVLNDSRSADYQGVYTWAVKNALDFRVASEVRENEYVVIISSPVDKIGGGELITLGFPLNLFQRRERRAPGKKLNRLGWPRGLVGSAIKDLFDMRFPRAVVDLPIASRLGRIKVLIPDGLDGAVYPGYPFVEIYDVFFFFGEHQKQGILRSTDKPSVPAPYCIGENPRKKATNDMAHGAVGRARIAVLLGGMISASVYVERMEVAVEKLKSLAHVNDLVLRPHPDTLRPTGQYYDRYLRMYDEIESCGAVIDSDYASNHMNIIERSDIVIVDAGSMVIDAYLAGKNIVLIEHPCFERKTGELARLINSVVDPYPFNVLEEELFGQIVSSKVHLERNSKVVELIRKQVNIAYPGMCVKEWARVAKYISDLADSSTNCNTF